MIKFKSVCYKNLMAVGDTSITILLDRSPTTSMNSKNGTGKSILIEAISFGLFGKSFRGLTKGELVNTTNKRNTEVKLEFSVNSVDIKVVRGIKPDTFTIEKNGVLIPEIAALEYQKILEKIIGFDHAMFSKTIALGYANYTPFMTLTKAQRRQFIEDALGLSVFAEMNKIIKADATAHNAVISDTNTKIVSTESYLDAIKVANSAAQNSVAADIKDLQDKIGAILETVVAKKSDLASIQSESKFDPVSDRGALNKVKQELADIDSDGRIIKKEFADATTMLQFYNNNDICPSCKTNMTVEHKNVHIRELNQKISDAKESAAKLVADKQTKQNLVNDLQARLDAAEQLDRKAAVINSEIADMINRAKFYKNEIVKKQNSTSGIVDTTEHESRLKTLSDSLAGALVRQDEYKIALELLKDNGIKAGVIEKYIPVLNKKINELLDVIGFGVQLKFDEQFQETLVGRYADEFSYNSLSQGERERMNLAIMFAWNYLMGLSSGVDSNLLILDEIGMSALDADGVQSLFQLIENEYGDGNVFVISHNPEVQHLCRSAIKFVKKDGFVRML